MSERRGVALTSGAVIGRSIAFVSGAAALILAYPHPPWWIFPAMLLAVFPRTWAPTVLMLLVAVFWLIQTEAHPAELTVVRLCGLALALYYLHVSTALVAVLPHDGRAAPGLYRPWLRRVGVVTVLTIAATLLVASMESLSGGRTASTGVWIAELAVGLPLAVGGGLLLMLFGKRDPGS